MERLSSDGQRLTARLLLAPREVITVAVLSPAGEVLRAECVAKGEGAVVAYGDRDVALALPPARVPTAFARDAFIDLVLSSFGIQAQGRGS